MSIPKRRVFLEFQSDQEIWKMPVDYMKAIEEYLQNEPTNFYLSWPDDLIQSAGDKLYFSNLMEGMGEVVVKEVEYGYCRKRGFNVYVIVEAIKEKRSPFGIYDLTYAAEEGLLFEDFTPISKALKAAGLPATVAALKRKKKN